jgi:WD40 repeat protein
MQVPAAECDVNVISWNRLVGYMLASGADDGGLRVWDLRAFKEGGFVSQLNTHRCGAGVVAVLARVKLTEECTVQACTGLYMCANAAVRGRG